tara:strand:+ start:73 stop:411 length:339 start_codon:yes stop_codon:yes gene_type:complete
MAKKGGARKDQPKGSRLAYDDLPKKKDKKPKIYTNQSAIAKKALANKAITRKQYDRLPPSMLDGISKHNLAMQSKARKTPAKGGVKEVHKKTGAEAHKKGRPKKGSKVTVDA